MISDKLIFMTKFKLRIALGYLTDSTGCPMKDVMLKSFRLIAVCFYAIRLSILVRTRCPFAKFTLRKLSVESVLI